MTEILKRILLRNEMPAIVLCLQNPAFISKPDNAVVFFLF